MSNAQAEVSFYQLTTHPLEKVLPKLLEKTYHSGLRALVVASSQAQAQGLNAALWTYSPGAFLPHGMKGSSSHTPQDHPIWITTDPHNENDATVLVLTDERYVEDLSAYGRCVDIFDGNNPPSLASAQERYHSYRQNNHTVIYWQQSLQGTWDQVTFRSVI